MPFWSHAIVLPIVVEEQSLREAARSLFAAPGGCSADRTQVFIAAEYPRNGIFTIENAAVRAW
jgi:hypothetical protein